MRRHIGIDFIHGHRVAMGIENKLVGTHDDVCQAEAQCRMTVFSIFLLFLVQYPSW